MGHRLTEPAMWQSPEREPWVKICGVTTLEDARIVVDAGADAIGINFWSKSPRCVSVDQAKRIVEECSADVIVIGVFVNADDLEIARVRSSTGIHWAQLHGDESPELLSRCLPHAYKALRVTGPQSIVQAKSFDGGGILLDAFVPGSPGGTGKTFDWALAKTLAAQRRVILAGGLRVDNVADAVRQVRPFGVDVSSGVESQPAKKDPELVKRFVEKAKYSCSDS